MDMKYGKSVLFATTALGIGLTGVGPALAQDADGGDIVVTARRIEERLQDVPISITVFNQQQLDDRNVRDLTDLTTYTPSLQTNNEYANSTQASFSIRGFVQDTFTAPSVGVYFADVIAPRSASSITSGEGAGPGSMFDLQNVQVLKGPQGTLFGRNTTGGAVLLVPQRPTDEFEGYLEGSIGNFGMNRLQGVVNVPLGDRARARFGVDRMTRDGYMENLTNVGPDHFSDVDYFAARGSLVVDLASNLENYSILSYSHSHTNGGLGVITAANPASIYGGFSQGQIDGREASGNFWSGQNAVQSPYDVMEQWQFINTTTWDVSDNLTIKNIGSYAEVRNATRAAIFGNAWDPADASASYQGAFGPPAPGPVFIPFGNTAGPGLSLNHASTLTEEIQFQGRALDNRLTWQAGAYYEKVSQLPDLVGTQGYGFGTCDETLGYDSSANLPTNLSSCYFMLPNIPQAFGGSTINREVRTSEFRDAAVYAQGTYEITDRLSTTLGLRYTDDESTATAQAFTWGVTGAPGSYAVTPATCSDPAADLAADCVRNFSQHSNATTGDLVFEYQATDNTNTYIKYSRGYRQGQVNPRGFDFLASFGQEQVDLYEIGVKTNWRGAMPGYFNFAIFRNDFQNQQIQVSYAPLVGNSLASGICACGKSVIEGFEMDGSISPFHGFRLTGGLAHLDADLTKFDLPAGPPGFPTPTVDTNILNLPLAYSPQYKYSLTAAYTLPLSENVGEITASVTFSHTDDYYLRQTRVEDYDLVNLNLNWNSVFSSPVDLSLFGTNVGNAEYYTSNSSSLFDQLGFTNSVTGEPRMYGMRLRYNFGARAN